MSFDWNKVQQNYNESKKPQQAPDVPMPQDGMRVEAQGVNKGIDKYGKLNVECTDAKQILDLKAQYPNIKFPVKVLYGFGGQKCYLTISLGYSKNDQALIQKINSFAGTKCSFSLYVEKYNTPKFGKGVFFVLADFKGLEIPLL